MITLSILHLRSECVAFSTPPPPASSLTRFDRHCYNHLSCHHLTSHHLTSLLLVLCLALGLVACQSGGSSASSANNDENISVKDGSDSSGNDDSDINGDETPTLVDNADISIADLSDGSKNIISMREFLLTVTYNNLNTQQELNFIVGESTTPPTWNSVKANPTKITRTFDKGNLKTRRIYFSATEKLTGVSFDADGNATITGKVIDLSQAGSQSEADYTKAQAPGIMTPNTSYYVYVYDSRGALVKQQKVTTAGYPNDASSFTNPPQVGAVGVRTSDDDEVSYEEYFWGMDAWRDANGVYQIVNEVKKDEVFFLPLRMRSPVDWDLDANDIVKNFCITSTESASKSMTIRGAVGTLSTDLFVISESSTLGSPANLTNTDNTFSFANSPAIFNVNFLSSKEVDEIFDFMLLARPVVEYDQYIACFNIGGLLILDFGSSFSFTLITE